MMLPDLAPFFQRLRHGNGILAAALVLDVVARPLLSYHSQLAILIEAVCWTGIVGLVLYGNVPSFCRWLEGPVWRFFGRISYSYFLLHFFVLWALLRHLPEHSVNMLSGGNRVISALLVWVLVVGLTIPLAMLSYRWVEMPGIRLGRHLADVASLLDRAAPRAARAQV